MERLSAPSSTVTSLLTTRARSMKTVAASGLRLPRLSRSRRWGNSMPVSSDDNIETRVEWASQQQQVQSCRIEPRLPSLDAQPTGFADPRIKSRGLYLPTGKARIRLNPTEALIPGHLEHHSDDHDFRWRGTKPYIGLGLRAREHMGRDLLRVVRLLLPGDPVTPEGLTQWGAAHWPGYDPDLEDGLPEERARMIAYLVEEGFLRCVNSTNDIRYRRTDKPIPADLTSAATTVDGVLDEGVEEGYLLRLDPLPSGPLHYIRTDKAPFVAFSIFGNGCARGCAPKEIAADRLMLRGDIPADEVVKTPYSLKGPTREQYDLLRPLEGDGLHHGALTDEDYMNPSPELLAKVEARNARYRRYQEEDAAAERDWHERGEADIQRRLESLRNHDPDAISDDVWPRSSTGYGKSTGPNGIATRWPHCVSATSGREDGRAGHSYSEMMKANYRHLAAQGVPMYVDIVRHWPDAEFKAVIAEIDAAGRKVRNDD